SAIAVCAALPQATCPPTLVPSACGHRVEIKVWQHADGTSVGGDVAWGSAAHPAIADLPPALTRRGTDDGWREWTSGAFDYNYGGSIDAGALLFYPNQRSGQASSALIDAISIDDLGMAAVPNVACTIVNEATACGASGVCQYGRCAD